MLCGELQMLGFRMYDNETGRFTTPDLLWSAFPAQTPYHYAYNSPLTYRDPSGLAPEKEKEREELLDLNPEDVSGGYEFGIWNANEIERYNGMTNFWNNIFSGLDGTMSGVINWKDAFNTNYGDGGGRTAEGKGAENGQGDYYITPSGKIYVNPNGKGRKYVVSDESVAQRTFGNDENGNPIISFDNLDAYMLPDESTWDDIIKDIYIKIRSNNKYEDASAYGVDEDGNIIYSYGGQGEIDEWGRSNVSEAVKAAIKDVLAMGSLDFNLIIVHSHPHPDTGYGQFPSNPLDYDATSNYRGGMMINKQSVFFFGSSRGVFMQFEYGEIDKFIRGKK